MKSRQKFHRWHLFAAITSFSALFAGSAYAADIRVGVQSVPPDEVYLAKDWTKAYGVEAQITQFSSGGEMLKAFVAGRIDTANGGSARLVTLAAKQPDIFYIIATEQFGGDRYGVMVRANSPVKTVQELKGKKIGAVTGSGTFNTFRVYLQENGMRESDFKIVNMKVQDLRAALQEGIIDAAVAWEPHVSIAETMGVAKRIVSMKGVNKSPNFILVSRTFADQYPEVVTKFVASLIDAGNLIKSNPAEAGKLAAQKISSRGVKVDPKALELSFTRIDVDRQVTDDLIAELVPIAESMKKAGKIDHVPEFKHLVNQKFYDQAVKIAGKNS
jgi:ABC-type nitrate/sulfonate/bicarbonate transport system substrate-binding protein